MTQTQMHYFTIEQRETLQHRLEARAALLREELSEDVKADLNAEPGAASLAHDVTELRAVEAALARLHTPDYGLCEDCEAQITYARLYVNPIAMRCVGCQLRAEKA